MWEGIEAFTLHFTFFSNPSLSDSRATLSCSSPVIGGPVGRRRAAWFQHALTSSTLCHKFQLQGLCGQLALPDLGSLVALASFLACLPISLLPRHRPGPQLHLTCAPSYSCSSHGLIWPLWPQVPPIRCAFNATLTPPSGLADFQPWPNARKQQVYQMALPPAQRPEWPALCNS